MSRIWKETIATQKDGAADMVFGEAVFDLMVEGDRLVFGKTITMMTLGRKSHTG